MPNLPRFSPLTVTRKQRASIFVLAPKGQKGGASSAQAMRKLRGKITGKARQAEGGDKKATLAEKVSFIKVELNIDAAVPLATAIEEANKMMGLPTEGNGKLPEQVAALIRKIYLEP